MVCLSVKLDRFTAFWLGFDYGADCVDARLIKALVQHFDFSAETSELLATEIRVSSRLQSQCQVYILNMTIVRQNKFTQIFLALLCFDDQGHFIVRKIQIINLLQQFRCVFHPVLKDVGIPLFFFDTSNIFNEVRNRFSSETYACFVKKSLASFRYYVVVFAHVHEADCGPYKLR